MIPLRKILVFKFPYIYNPKKCFSVCLLSCTPLNLVSLCVQKPNFFCGNAGSFFIYAAARSFTTTAALSWEDGWGNKVFWQGSKKGKYEKKDDRPTMEMFRDGLRDLRSEVKLWQSEVKEKLEADPIFVRPGDMDKVFELNSEENLKQWVLSTDKDYKEGNSAASLTLSPNKCGLFKGYIDIRPPIDGAIKRAGFCNITTIPATKSFKRDTYHDWTQYTHLTMRIRGDGRSYLILIGTCGHFDITWSDLYTYVLYTRGGPYWQDVKIPFSKFLLSSTGRAQDKQSKIPLHRIQRIGVTACDRVTAPFYLEIDYLGLLSDPSHDEHFAYEMYKTPDFWVS